MFWKFKDLFNNFNTREKSNYYWPSNVSLHFFPESHTLNPSPYYQYPDIFDIITHPFKKSNPVAHSDQVIKLTEEDTKNLESKLSILALYFNECDIKEVNGVYSMRPSSCVHLRKILSNYIRPTE